MLGQGRAWPCRGQAVCGVWCLMARASWWDGVAGDWVGSWSVFEYGRPGMRAQHPARAGSRVHADPCCWVWCVCVQVKLVLAGAMWSQPHLLVLDEVRP